MNQTLDIIRKRRSIRAFQSTPVPEESLRAIVEAGLYAPSAVNRQSWHFSVIRDPELLRRMIRENAVQIPKSGYNPRVPADSPSYTPFYGAPAVILITADTTDEWSGFNCGAAAENMCLASASLGLGSVIVGSSRYMFLGEGADALRRDLGLPERYDHVCTVAIGYADGPMPKAPPRREGVVKYL